MWNNDKGFNNHHIKDSEVMFSNFKRVLFSTSLKYAVGYVE